MTGLAALVAPGPAGPCEVAGLVYEFDWPVYESDWLMYELDWLVYEFVGGVASDLYELDCGCWAWLGRPYEYEVVVGSSGTF